MEADTIHKIVYLIKHQVYDFGDAILLGHMENSHIMIVWEGSIQVRVERRNPVNREIESYWLDTLEKGSCISVFRCFDNSRSLVNYYASSKKVAVDFINA